MRVDDENTSVVLKIDPGGAGDGDRIILHLAGLGAAVGGAECIPAEDVACRGG